MSDRDMDKVARRFADTERKVEDVVRTRLLVQSTVRTDTGVEVPVGDGITDGQDALTQGGSLGDQVDGMDDVSDATVIDSTHGVNRLDPVAEASDTAYEAALMGWDSAQAAESKADGAAADALAAAGATQLLADGIYQVIPAVDAPTVTPVGPLKPGDQWWKIGSSGATEGKFIGVAVWNGTAWQDRQIVANSILVPGTVGNVLIADGAIDGEVITGPTIRTAASGQRTQLDTTGLRTFNASEVETARLSADSGGLALAGKMLVSNATTGDWIEIGDGRIHAQNDTTGEYARLDDDSLTLGNTNAPLGSSARFYVNNAGKAILPANAQLPIDQVFSPFDGLVARSGFTINRLVLTRRLGWYELSAQINGTVAAGAVVELLQASTSVFYTVYPDYNRHGSAWLVGGHTGTAWIRPNGSVAISQSTGGSRTNPQFTIMWPEDAVPEW